MRAATHTPMARISGDRTITHLGMTSCSSNCLDHKSIDTEPRENEHPEQKDW